MTLLELANALKAEAGLDGNALTGVTSLRGMDARVVRWISDEWAAIQNAQSWTFRNAEWAFDTVAGERSLVKPANCARFDQGFAIGISWQPWHELRAAQLDAGKPQRIADSGQTLMLDREPDGAYPVMLFYLRAAQVLTAAADVPQGISSDLHMIIVWGALMRYAGYDEASAVYQHAAQQYQRLQAEMTLRHLPAVTVDYGAMA